MPWAFLSLPFLVIEYHSGFPGEESTVKWQIAMKTLWSDYFTVCSDTVPVGYDILEFYYAFNNIFKIEHL